MKFFTPDLLERFGSEDHLVASAAQDEWEERAEEYARNLSEIEVRCRNGSGPPRPILFARCAGDLPTIFDGDRPGLAGA